MSADTNNEIDLQVEENTEESGLKLDVKDLQKTGVVTTSLVDRFEFQMFTESFIKEEADYKKSQKEQQYQMLTYVLHNEKVDENDHILNVVMNSNREAIIKQEHTEDGKMGNQLISMGFFTILGILIAGAVLIYIDKYSKNKKAKKGL